MESEDTGEQAAMSRRKKERDLLAGCVRSVIFVLVLVLVYYAAQIPGWLEARRAAWQSGAKSTLRTIASNQMTYANTHKTGNYGTIEALKDEKYLWPGAGLGNMARMYSMTWEVTNLSTVMEEIHTFTIIAYPRDTRPGKLYTFGITEDRKIRVYDPEEDHDFENVKTWDPIL